MVARTRIGHRWPPSRALGRLQHLMLVAHRASPGTSGCRATSRGGRRTSPAGSRAAIFANHELDDLARASREGADAVRHPRELVYDRSLQVWRRTRAYLGIRPYEVNSSGQEKPVLINVLLGIVALMLAAGPAVAQETREQTPGLTEGDSDVGTSAFSPIPTGYTVIYFFTGARTVFQSISSSVHCSNLLGVSTTVRVEVYTFDGFPAGAVAVQVPQYNTRSITIGSAAPVFAYDSSITPTAPLNQGIIRVLKKGTGRIICAAQVHDMGSPPSFVLPLVHWGPTGLH